MFCPVARLGYGRVMLNLLKSVTLIGLCLGLLIAIVGDPAAAAEDGDYQLLKATPDKVWRLNKRTGEIAVCALQGKRVVCTVSTEAKSPAALSDQELKARDKEKRSRDLAFFERIFALVQEFIRAALDQESAK